MLELKINKMDQSKPETAAHPPPPPPPPPPPHICHSYGANVTIRPVGVSAYTSSIRPNTMYDTCHFKIIKDINVCIPYGTKATYKNQDIIIGKQGTENSFWTGIISVKEGTPYVNVSTPFGLAEKFNADQEILLHQDFSVTLPKGTPWFFVESDKNVKVEHHISEDGMVVLV